jgi:hypothetical protein
MVHYGVRLYQCNICKHSLLLGYHWHQRSPGGSINIDLRFETAIPAGGITVMMIGIYDALVSIDKSQNVTVEF